MKKRARCSSRLWQISTKPCHAVRITEIGENCPRLTWKICMHWSMGCSLPMMTVAMNFFNAEARLSAAFLLVKHLDDCRPYADEIIFYQRVRKQILKTIPGRRLGRDLDRAIQDLVDDSLEPEGVVDIFKAAGIEKPDISILDDAFLQTFKDHPPESLQVKLLGTLTG